MDLDDFNTPVENSGSEESCSPNDTLIPESKEEREAFSAILKLLYRQARVDFTHYRQTTVLRRCARRIALAKRSNYSEYLQYLEKNTEEQRALHRDLLLNFTEFFRDPQVFTKLNEEIWPRLAKGRTVKNPIRVWVPGCSTGEEVYSLAICLYEFLEANKLEVVAQFFGTDLVDEHIVTARSAVYQEKIRNNINDERLERFFDRRTGGYRVVKHIREMCVFATQDVTQDPPFPQIDLLSCRNLLIYFDGTFQDTVIPLFHFALKPDGLLLLGTSETLGRFPQFFNPLDKRNNIFSKRNMTAKPHYKFPVSSSVFSEKIKKHSEAIHREKNSDIKYMERQIDKLLLEGYAPPGVLVDASMQIRLFRGKTARFLDPSRGEASLKLSKMAGNSLMPDIYVAVEECKRDGTIVKKRNIPFEQDTVQSQIDITVVPVYGQREGEVFYLIMFEELTEPAISPSTLQENDLAEDSVKDQEILQLRRELMATKDYLQKIIEEKDEVNQELWSANEEVQSTNEELQSVNEEMEAAKEELESSNEELISLNEELHLKNTELTEVNALNECTIEGSMDGILTFDNEFRVKIYNPAIARIWGVKKEICMDQSLFDLFPFLVENGQKEMLHAVLQGEAGVTENQPYFNRQRSVEGFFEGRYSPLRDHSDQIIGGLAVIHDSTEKKIAEEKLLESEERFKKIMHQSPVALEVYDVDGVLVAANKACVNLWGVSQQRTVFEFNSLQDDDLERAGIAKYIEKGFCGETVFVPEYQLELVVEGSNVKNICWLNTRIYPLKDRNGKVKNIVMSHEDITSRKRAESDLAKLQKLESIGTLAGGIAHDFNNILMGLYGNLTLARLELDDVHPASQHLDDAEHSMTRATDLTKQLLIFAKGGSPVREGVSLGNLMEDTVRFDLSGSSVKPVFDISEDLWIAEVDKGQIQQVFSSLTVNALQAMPRGGHLFVALENCVAKAGEIQGLPKGKYVRVTMKDEGEGIPSELQTQIFDPYFSTKTLGRGLGLATTYSIVKKHGGAILVESQAGKGASFTLFLPIIKETRGVQARTKSVKDIARTTSLYALIMDDEPMVCKVVSRFLEKDGFTIETAADGKEAIQKYRLAMEMDRSFDIVIMDLTIPGGMGGCEAVGKLLEIDPSAKVIVSSGYADDPVMANFAEYSFKGIVAKPYSREGLLLEVTRVLAE